MAGDANDFAKLLADAEQSGYRKAIAYLRARAKRQNEAMQGLMYAADILECQLAAHGIPAA